VNKPAIAEHDIADKDQAPTVADDLEREIDGRDTR
jgi:hypothetical protein